MIAYLQLGNNEIRKYSQEFLVKNVSCKFIRSHNENRPTEDAVCEAICISVYISGNEDGTLYNWFINGESQEGRVLILMSDPRKDEEDDTTIIEFSNAVCYEMKEEYEIDNKRRIITFGLIATDMKLDEVEFNK